MIMVYLSATLFYAHEVLFQNNTSLTRSVVLELVLDTSLKYFMYSFKKFITRSCRGEL